MGDVQLLQEVLKTIDVKDRLQLIKTEKWILDHISDDFLYWYMNDDNINDNKKYSVMTETYGLKKISVSYPMKVHNNKYNFDYEVFNSLKILSIHGIEDNLSSFIDKLNANDIISSLNMLKYKSGITCVVYFDKVYIKSKNMKMYLVSKDLINVNEIIVNDMTYINREKDCFLILSTVSIDESFILSCFIDKNIQEITKRLVNKRDIICFCMIL